MKYIMRTMRTIFSAISLLLSASFCANALTVSTTAGDLKSQVPAPAEVTTLTVTGEVNVLDFEFISSEMTALTSLNLADASVAAYEGAATATGRTSTPANTLPECALMLRSLSAVVLPSNLTAIADGAMGGSGITSVTIPQSVTTIGAGAFGNCQSLKSVVLPSSVNEIGTGAFRDCKSLTSAVISGRPALLPTGVFMGCTALSEVSLPASVKEIGDDAFNGCVALAAVEFPESLEKIGNKAFMKTALASADLSGCASLTTIGNWAFADCSALSDVKFGPEVASIGTGAFYNDADLPLGELPANVTKISDFSLRGTAGADPSFLAASQVDSIGAYALANWTAIHALTIPASVQHIGDGAMANWTNLSEISAADVESVPTLGEDVWRGVNQPSVKLTVPQSLVDEFMATPQWKDFDIVGDTTSSDITIADAAVDAGGLTARFEGMTLVVESASVPVAEVRVYDVQGRRFSMPVAAESHRVSVDTSAWNTKVMIVNVLLGDGTAAALKLSRP